MYEICSGRPLPENGQEWQDMRDGNLRPMDGTEFDLQMTVRSMMAPDHASRPSAEELLRKRQLMSEDQRQLIVERNKANEANRALNVQMVRRWHPTRWTLSARPSDSDFCDFIFFVSDVSRGALRGQSLPGATLSVDSPT